MAIYPDLVICEHCDTVHQRRGLVKGEVASCTACDAELYRCGGFNIRERLALSVTAGIAFLIANLCPIIRINLHGLESQTTMWQAAAALDQG
ncbi:MAG: paraquat-inducible protein A, partial [Pseudomonadota bacterium]|nr:paraquat-inducible protein A [Pseudomonadota bacterium]